MAAAYVPINPTFDKTDHFSGYQRASVLPVSALCTTQLLAATSFSFMYLHVPFFHRDLTMEMSQ